MALPPKIDVTFGTTVSSTTDFQVFGSKGCVIDKLMDFGTSTKKLMDVAFWDVVHFNTNFQIFDNLGLTVDFLKD